MPDVRKTVTDAGYIAIGLGVMGFQQAQVRRRELQERLESASGCVAECVRDVRGQVAGLADELGTKVEPLVEQVQDRLGDLPEQAQKAVEHGRARVQSLVGSAA